MRSEISKIMVSKLAKLAPKTTTKILFKHFLGYRLNLKNPKTLNEKLQYLKLTNYMHNSIVTKCADKYAVREYVEKRVGVEYLVGLLGVWNNASEIDFDSLPDKFALKCNHGSGTNVICRDKSQLDIGSVKTKLDKWLKTDFGYSRAEFIYDKIPRKIICEEFIETSDNKPPKDYKFFCNNGKAKFLFVATDRYNEQTKFDYFDINWNWIPVQNGHPNADASLKKPDNFDEMIRIAEKLSEGFPLVRIDLYNENGRIIFGEMTFLHHSGLTRFDPDKYDLILGQMIVL